jgi:hypothetical protein
MARTRIIIPCLLALFCGPMVLSGQQPPPAAETTAAEIETAPVMIDEMRLFTVRGIAAFPAEERARAITRRIVEIASDPKISTDSLKVLVRPDCTEIAAGGIIITRVFDADADLELDNMPRGLLAEVYLQRIREAVEKYRLDRAPARLLRSGLAAAGATA